MLKKVNTIPGSAPVSLGENVTSSVKVITPVFSHRCFKEVNIVSRAQSSHSDHLKRTFRTMRGYPLCGSKLKYNWLIGDNSHQDLNLTKKDPIKQIKADLDDNKEKDYLPSALLTLSLSSNPQWGKRYRQFQRDTPRSD